MLLSMADLRGMSNGSAPGAPDPRTNRTWRRAVHGYVLLPHLVPVLVVELATALFAIIAWGGLPPARLLVPLLLAMLGGQLAIGAINEIVDLPEDALGKPDKPLPSGAVSLRGAQTMVLAGLMLLLVFGLPFGAVPFALLALGTGWGIAYDLWFKRTPLSWLPYVMALPLLPIWVFSALGRPEPRLLLLLPLGALATVGVHLAQSLPDAAIDRAAGSSAATSRLGARAAFVLAWLMAVSAPLLAWIGAARLGDIQSPGLILAAAGLTVLFLATNLVLVAANLRIGIAACFPLVAMSTLASAVLWTLAVAG
jgi:4-hydroxybenzoate polyprenyltransferase